MTEHIFFHTLDRSGRAVRLGAAIRGDGARAVLFLHDVGASAFLWEDVLKRLPDDWRAVAVDGRGAGRSDKDGRDQLGPREQAFLLRPGTLQCGAERSVVVCAHGTGCAAALLLAADPEWADRIDRLILFSPIWNRSHLPSRLVELGRRDFGGGDSREAAKQLLSELDFPIGERKRFLAGYAGALEGPGYADSLRAAATALRLEEQEPTAAECARIACCVRIFYGGNEEAGMVRSARRLASRLKCGEAVELPRFSFWSMVESPATVAARIVETVQGVAAESEASAGERKFSTGRFRKFRMARLFDRWSVEAFLLFGFIKLLQFLKFCGLSPVENGWRKATGIFLKNENAKFTLASFFLRYNGDAEAPETVEEAKKRLILRLAEFLRGEDSVHWAVRPGIMRIRRRRLEYTDVVELEYDNGGRIVRVVPYFEDGEKAFPALTRSDRDMLLGNFIKLCNEQKRSRAGRSSRKLELFLRQVALSANKFDFNVSLDLSRMIDRLLTATVIHFSVLSADSATAERARFASPDVKGVRHPGSGLLNIDCRLEHDFSAASIFVQYHHVPVDGLPMQELMDRLKAEWGAVRPTVYPAAGSPAARPEIFYSGDRLFRARIYVDFSRLLAVRRRLNAEHRAEMGGEATVAAMLLWGLARHPFFRDRKMLLPVDMRIDDEPGTERKLGLVFIRPAEYEVEGRSPLENFCDFQREFNRRCRKTRIGRSESVELLELYAMIHPLFYYFARRCFPKALHEMVGTVGLSIMRDAEMFLAPLSDLQSDGFMAVGSMCMPTRDGLAAGAVSICGRRAQIGQYIEAVNRLAAEYDLFLGMKPGNSEYK